VATVVFRTPANQSVGSKQASVCYCYMQIIYSRNVFIRLQLD